MSRTHFETSVPNFPSALGFMIAALTSLAALRDLRDEVLRKMNFFKKPRIFCFKLFHDCFKKLRPANRGENGLSRATAWQAAASRSITGRVAASEETARNVAYRQRDADEGTLIPTPNAARFSTIITRANRYIPIVSPIAACIAKNEEWRQTAIGAYWPKQ